MKLREPDIDEFLILACDGLWDVMSIEEVCDYVYSQIRQPSKDLKCIANDVVDMCMAKGCSDNITIIIVDLLPLTDHIENTTSITTKDSNMEI